MYFFCLQEIDEHLRSAGATWSLFDVLTSSEENSMIHRTGEEYARTHGL